MKPSFLNESVGKWSENENYMKLKEPACTLKVTNDCAERALGMLTEFSVDRVTRDKDQRQYLLQVVKELRERQKNLKESRQGNRCAKKILKMKNT